MKTYDATMDARIYRSLEEAMSDDEESAICGICGQPLSDAAEEVVGRDGEIFYIHSYHVHEMNIAWCPICCETNTELLHQVDIDTVRCESCGSIIRRR